MGLSSPRPIDERHQVGAFDSGVAVLDDWLKRRARSNQTGGASRTYVVCDADRVVAYYALAAGAVEIAAATSRVRRNMPDPVPVVVLGRLAIEQGYQGKGLGRALVKDALSPAIINLGATLTGISAGLRRLFSGNNSKDA